MSMTDEREDLEMVVHALATTPPLASYRTTMRHDITMNGMDILIVGTHSYCKGMYRIEMSVSLGAERSEITIVRNAEMTQWIEHRHASGEVEVVRFDMATFTEVIDGDPDLAKGFRRGINYQPEPDHWYEWLGDMDATCDGIATLDNQEVFVLSGIQNNEFLSFLDVKGDMRASGMLPMDTRVFVSVEHAFPLRTEFASLDQSIVGVIDFSDFKANPEGKRDEFVYRVPEGVSVVDDDLTGEEDEDFVAPLSPLEQEDLNAPTPSVVPVKEKNTSPEPKKKPGGLFDY